MAEKSTWISIDEKMPTTRETVMVYFKNKWDKDVITIATYIAPKTVLAEEFLHEDHQDFSEYDEENDCYWANSGFYENQYESEISYHLSETISHWIPLPSAPEVIR